MDLRKDTPFLRLGKSLLWFSIVTICLNTQFFSLYYLHSEQVILDNMTIIKVKKTLLGWNYVLYMVLIV